MRNHNEIPSSITPPIDFGNTDLLKIMTDLCYEPVRSASPLELLSTEAVLRIAHANPCLARPHQAGSPIVAKD